MANASSATCSGASTLRLKRIAPPRSNSRASDRHSTGSCVPVKLPIRSWPISRLVPEGMRIDDYNLPVRILASAPTRIDLAGGTIDIWPLYLFHRGAQTLNVAISLRAHARVEPIDNGGI